MKGRLQIRMGMSLAVLIVLSLALTAQQPGNSMDRSNMKKMDRGMVEHMMSGWPPEAKKAAMAIMQKYGPPQEATESMLLWHNNGPWKHTIAYRETVDHNFPMPHKDSVEQFVAYKVPPDKFDDLAEYDGSVIAERTKGVISARCDKEEANFLALNLANDIVTGKRDVEEARKMYGEAIKKMMMGDKGHAYLQGLQFDRMRASTADPDQALMSMDSMGMKK